jgi:hypothetical protein
MDMLMKRILSNVVVTAKFLHPGNVDLSLLSSELFTGMMLIIRLKKKSLPQFVVERSLE